jgi:uncharacterized protein (TIGR03437 family)
MKLRLHIVVLAMLAAAQANGYYFWTHYTLSTSPYNPVPEKFDLTVLPNQTVTFFVTDTGPSVYSGNDSFAPVISQVRQAAQAWNSVSTSNLRVAFGGTYTSGTPQNTPSGQVIFQQLPPGVLGYGGVSSMANIGASPNGSFYPILTSFMYLTANLAQLPGPSYTDFFFLDVVHEMGHALGLQHTFTSSAMSQATTRTTNLVRTIDTDDVAGISVLYPAANFSSQFGSISGRVSFSNGQPVHLASVVAIRNGASAVSAFTNPDGSYRMDGVPAGLYYVYVHPLPPDSNVVSPLDTSGKPVNPSNPFVTTYYPGATTFSPTLPTIPVAIGSITSNINFSVAPLAAVPLYDVQIYPYAANMEGFGSIYLNENSSVGTSVVQGVGLGTNGVAAPGLSAQVLGGAANIYASLGYGDGLGDTYFAMYTVYGLGAGTGPQHVVFTLPNYSYVANNLLDLTLTNSPSISNIVPNPDGSVTITGANFTPSTSFFLDGAPVPLRSLDPVNNIAIGVPPAGASGQRATAMALNSDGQNSFFTQANAPATYAYPVTALASVSLNPAVVPAGVEAMVDITGNNTNFAQGQTIVGFGTSDVYVRQVFVLTPTHLQVDVYIPVSAARTATEVSVFTGFQSAVQPAAFQISAPVPQLPVASPLLINTAAGQTTIYSGANVVVNGSNLQVGSALPVVTFNGIQAVVASATSTQINLQIPAGLTAGLPATMVVSNGVTSSLPVDVAISGVPTAITAALSSAGVQNDAGHPARAGDVVTFLVSNFGDPVAGVAASRVQLSINGTTAPVFIVAPYQGTTFQIQTIIPSVAPGNQPVTIFLDGHVSVQGSIFVSQ